MKTESIVTASDRLKTTKGYPKKVKRVIEMIKTLRGLNRIPNRPSRPQKEGAAQTAYDQHWGKTPDKASAHFWLAAYSAEDSRRVARAAVAPIDSDAKPTDSLKY